MRVMSRPTVVVALKDLASAKSRFAAPAPLRGRLALCMLADTVRGWAATDARVIVVSDVDGLGWRLRAFGVTADVVPDGTGDLNAAFARGATQAGEGLVVASVADLPLLTSTVAQKLLADAEALGPVGGFVADATGTGTTVVTGAHPSPLRPPFGPGSPARPAPRGRAAPPPPPAPPPFGTGRGGGPRRRGPAGARRPTRGTPRRRHRGRPAGRTRPRFGHRHSRPRRHAGPVGRPRRRRARRRDDHRRAAGRYARAGAHQGGVGGGRTSPSRPAAARGTGFRT